MASILPETNELALKGIDANRYATKKTIAQGMLDIALLTSNASQLKYILQAGEKHEFYHFMLVLVSISICLQIFLALCSIALIYFPYPERTISRGGGRQKINPSNTLRCLDFLLTSFAFLVTVLNMIAQGALAVFIGSIDINKEEHHRKANLCQNGALVMNMVTVIINIMINTMEIKSLNGFMGGGAFNKDL